MSYWWDFNRKINCDCCHCNCRDCCHKRICKGEKGDKGDTGATGASGKNGATPEIINNNWWINGIDTGISAVGEKGDSGNDGITPHIDNTTGTWWIGTTDTGIKAQGEKGERGDKGEAGEQGLKGDKGDIGATPQITATAVSVPSTSPANVIQTGTPENPIFTFEIPKGQDGSAGLTPRIYHADLSKVGNQIEIWIDGIRAQWIYNTSTSISFNIHASGNNVLIDLKRSSQYDGTASEGSTLDNYTLTSAYQAVDTIVYNSSREMHRTWIRTKNPTTGLWNLYQIDLCVSNGGARTDIIVWTIYENLAAPW